MERRCVIPVILDLIMVREDNSQSINYLGTVTHYMGRIRKF